MHILLNNLAGCSQAQGVTLYRVRGRGGAPQRREADAEGEQRAGERRRHERRPPQRGVGRHAGELAGRGRQRGRERQRQQVVQVHHRQLAQPALRPAAASHALPLAKSPLGSRRLHRASRTAVRAASADDSSRRHRLLRCATSSLRRGPRQLEYAGGHDCCIHLVSCHDLVRQSDRVRVAMGATRLSALRTWSAPGGPPSPAPRPHSRARAAATESITPRQTSE